MDAFQAVNNYKDKAIKESEIKRNKFINEHPEYENIETQISKAIIEVTRSVLLGEKNKNEIEKIEAKNKSLQKQKAEILLSAGKSKDYLRPVFSCKICNDSGYADGKMCNCVKKIAKKIIYDRLNNITPLENSIFENFNLLHYSNTEDENGINARKRMSKIFKHCLK